MRRSIPALVSGLIADRGFYLALMLHPYQTLT